MKRISVAIGVVALAITMLCGCKTQTGFIVMANATTLGFDVSYNGAQPQATLAYKRAEVAFVPCTTNYTPDTLMEFRFKSSIFTSSGGIYSRMATGPNATVSSPAALMMSKSPNGNLPTNSNFHLSFPSPIIRTDK
jgi:hypothetical protein